MSSRLMFIEKNNPPKIKDTKSGLVRRLIDVAPGGCLKGGFNMPAMLEVSHKQSAIRAAKELRYSKEVIDKLKKAVSDNEITRIMFSARNAEWSGERGMIT